MYGRLMRFLLFAQLLQLNECLRRDSLDWRLFFVFEPSKAKCTAKPHFNPANLCGLFFTGIDEYEPCRYTAKFLRFVDLLPIVIMPQRY